MFCYSYANYHDHLGIGNIRFETLMPDTAEIVEQAAKDDWPLDRLAQKEEIDTDEAAARLAVLRNAIEIVDAENPAESFRNAVWQVIKRVAEEGLNGDQAIEDLVTQVCYRASDLAYLLQQEGKPLSRYSRHLRREPDVEYFDEKD